MFSLGIVVDSFLSVWLLPQVPDSSGSAPETSGPLFEVPGDGPMPSMGGSVGVDVAVPSVDDGASDPSASIDLHGK